MLDLILLQTSLELQTDLLWNPVLVRSCNRILFKQMWTLTCYTVHLHEHQTAH